MYCFLFICAGDPEQIVSFFREFIDHHFFVLRKRQSEAKYLVKQAQKAGMRASWGGPELWNQYDDIPEADPSIEDKVKWGTLPY